MDDPKPGCSGVKKRKFNLIYKDNEYGKKRREEEDNSIILSVSDKCLLDLPDDVVFIIGRKLKPFDLYSLSRTCLRFDSIITERSLWKYVDFRDTTDITTNLLNYFNRFLSPSTIAYSTRSIRRYNKFGGFNSLVTGKLLQSIKSKCPELKILRIENDVIIANELTMKDMPPSLEVLSLSDTYMLNKPSNFSYFFRVEKCLPKLTTICLRNCNWFEPHSLMLLSKLPLLQHLDLSYCSGMKECMAYFSLSARYGFLQLKTFDLRGTHLCDSEISCLNILPSLAKLLLDCPEESREMSIPDPITLPDVVDYAVNVADMFRGPRDIFQLAVQRRNNRRGFELPNLNELQVAHEAGVFNRQLRRVIEVELQEANVLDHNIGNIIPDFFEGVIGNVAIDNNLPQEIPIENNDNAPDNIIGIRSNARINRDEVYRDANVIVERMDPLRHDVHNSTQNNEMPRENLNNENPESNTSHCVNCATFQTVDSGKTYQSEKPNHKTTQTNIATSQELDEMDAYLEDRGKPSNKRDLVIPSYAPDDFNADFPRHDRFVALHVRDRSRPREAGAVANEIRPNDLERSHCFLSDRAICSFGTSPASNEPNLVRIQAEYMPQQREPVLEHLALRNYTLITDQSLRHLAHAAPKLNFLDVTGSKVTEEGVIQFKMNRPDCEILSNYLIDQSDS